MALLIGVVLAFAVGLFASRVKLDRDRAFYTTVMLVIAFLYTLFAVIGSSTHAIIIESVVGLMFAALAVSGFKSSLWLVVAALAGHGIFDSFHGRVISNPGVPDFWPAFCAAYDVTAAGYLTWLLLRKRVAVS